MTTGVTATGRTTPSILQQGRPPASREASSHSLQPEEEEEEVTLEGEELFMTLTPEEEAAWRAMLEARQTTLQSQREAFVKWKDGFTRRRMFAYSRIRRLQETCRQRGASYGDLAEYIAALEAKVKAKKKVKFEDTPGEPNCQVANGQTASGLATNPEAANGQTSNSQAANGQTTNSQAANGQTPNPQAANGQSTVTNGQVNGQAESNEQTSSLPQPAEQQPQGEESQRQQA